MYASTSAHDPPRCVCGVGVRACMCVCALARKPVNVCVCHVNVSARARACWRLSECRVFVVQCVSLSLCFV